MNQQKLDISQNYFLESEDAKIISGSVNVYVTCFNGDLCGARVFLCQGTAGDTIPAFSYKQDAKNYKLFISSAYQNANEENAVVKFVPADIKAQKQFLEKTDTHKAQGTFEEILCEIYDLEHLEDTRNIYASQKLNNDTISQIHDDIVYSHNKQKYYEFSDYPDSTDLFYAIKHLFDYSNISRPDENLVDPKDKFDKQINDYATLARVLTRKVKLNPGWEKQDLGPLLCFDKQSGEPVACIPTRSNKYRLRSKNTYKNVYLTSKIAAQLTNKAYVFYRPLPNESLTLNDVFRFTFKSIKLKDILNIVVFGLGCSLIGLCVPQFSNFVYGKYIFESDFSSILTLGLVVIVALVCAACFALMRGLVSFAASSKMKYALQAGLFGRLFNLPQSFINRHNSADLSLRAAGASSAFGILNTELINVGLSALFSLVFLFQMFSYYTFISIVSLILVLLAGLGLMIIFAKQVKVRADIVQIESDKSSLLFGLIKGVAKLRVANAEARGLKKYMDLHIKSTQCNYEFSRLNIVSSAIYTSFTLLANIIIFALIMAGGVSDSYTQSMGNFVAFLSSFALFSSAILQFPLSLSNFSAAIPYIKRMEPILQQSPENVKAQKLGTLERGEIVVNNMSFTYSPEFDNILSNINLHIHPGEYLGIVGKSGSGKTTLMNLLLGFETPTGGKIYYDNQDWEFLDKCQMRQKFGVMLQDGDIIPGSIFDNITITKPDATMEEAMAAVELVGLTDEIRKFPMGIHTFISSDSDTISGGQKQRILIARSVINNPKIIFMDEATSALDNATQAHIIEGLAELDATRVVVAHRLSTVIDCDRIIVIDSGGIAEEGNYDTLMQKHGIFYSLVKRQVA